MARFLVFLIVTVLAFLLLGGIVMAAVFATYAAGQGPWLMSFFVEGGWGLIPLASIGIGIWAARDDADRTV